MENTMYWDNGINVCGTLIQLNSKIQNLISYICALIIIVWVYMIYHINQVLRKLVLLMICRQNTLYIYNLVRLVYPSPTNPQDFANPSCLPESETG